ncbi:MAG: ABC transporter ATP-binding protein [Desulfobacterales bacterium]|jgi:lipoprotein-releasing system ATP-binding protein|nr:ABC transporter ATP-binding protein [Desulfobacterales bacterium]MDD3081705.1 ABC transporter ATP-binding protein [Desulfobacterales bacterium]MDD3949797.1 ABC transporter ATP-binding protein [Desulfobacterales bacterium]MDD4462943.1 ABC transporter ATP-binding protein [Desulfobacterales bacterium]MDY0378816.1 ABC transporter ATP-binding protein [Desulfobacterales bacterium]
MDNSLSPHHPVKLETAQISPLIEVRDLYKSFDAAGARIDILKGVDMNLASGQTLAVVGASGIGKSTLLHILGALDRPDRGSVLIQGQDMFQLNNGRLAEFRNQTVGFVFQFHHLLAEFNSLENVMMPVLIQGRSKEAARRCAEEILVRVGLKDRLLHPVNRLSGGEQQRVALARALALRPLILLADEPTGNLDKRNSDQVHELLLELNRELGMTMVVVTHNMELAAFMSRCVTLLDGKLVQTD